MFAYRVTTRVESSPEYHLCIYLPEVLLSLFLVSSGFGK